MENNIPKAKCVSRLSARSLNLHANQLADGVAAVRNDLLLMEPVPVGTAPAENLNRVVFTIKDR